MLKIANIVWLTLVVVSGLPAADSMTGMTGPNHLANGRFLETEEVVYPWTGVDNKGYLRKSVQHRGVNIYVDKSNQFSYGYFANSASFVDLDADNLPDLVAPDGAGFFWFWKNIGVIGTPKFGLGEVMPLLVDNERSQFANTAPPTKPSKPDKAQEREQESVDKKREKAVEQLERQNKTLPQGQQWTRERIIERVKQDLPYSWEAAARKDATLGSTICTLNGFRQLRAVAAPCDLNRDGLADFLVGDAQGTLYFAKNGGRPGRPDYRTYTKSQDGVVLKYVPSYNVVTRKSTLTPASFMNYATPYVCDWDRNGVPDVLLGEGTYSVNAIRLFLNFTQANLTSENGRNEFGLMIGENRTFLSPFAWDWDGDGWLDLFVNDGEGRFTVFPNPGGRYANGQTEMTECRDLSFEGKTDNAFFKFCCPQPCDWNADGIMDIVWSEPYGRIFYALGKEKGGLLFGPPTPIKTSTPERVRQLTIPKETSFCAAPATRSQSFSGGTGDAQRYVSQSGGAENTGGWGKPMRIFYGVMPGWDPDEFFAEDKKGRKLYPIPKLSASWGIAPVPYELFTVLSESGGDNGLGNTFVQGWHNPADNAVFKQPRDAMTKFGQGVSIAFMGAEKLREQISDTNVRVSFFMKLEGKFERLSVVGEADYHKDNYIPEGGRMTFKTMTPPPTGQWFHYQSVVAKGKYPRSFSDVNLWLTGRGTVWIRDVAYATTDLPPDQD